MATFQRLDSRKQHTLLFLHMAIQFGHQFLYSLCQTDKFGVGGTVARRHFFYQLLDHRAALTDVLVMHIIDVVGQKAQIPRIEIVRNGSAASRFRPLELFLYLRFGQSGLSNRFFYRLLAATAEIDAQLLEYFRLAHVFGGNLADGFFGLGGRFGYLYLPRLGARLQVLPRENIAAFAKQLVIKRPRVVVVVDDEALAL